jgi:hypothetical protein
MSLPDLPMLRAPESWPVAVAALTAMVALAVLDLIGALFAKDWATSRSPWSFAAGVLAFAVLFWVYASSLQYAELATVTLGWIVMLQVALLLVDRFHFGVALPPAKICAVVAILALQAFLLVGPDGAAP